MPAPMLTPALVPTSYPAIDSKPSYRCLLRYRCQPWQSTPDPTANAIHVDSRPGADVSLGNRLQTPTAQPQAPDSMARLSTSSPNGMPQPRLRLPWQGVCAEAGRSDDGDIRTALHRQKKGLCGSGIYHSCLRRDNLEIGGEESDHVLTAKGPHGMTGRSCFNPSISSHRRTPYTEVAMLNGMSLKPFLMTDTSPRLTSPVPTCLTVTSSPTSPSSLSSKRSLQEQGYMYLMCYATCMHPEATSIDLPNRTLTWSSRLRLQLPSMTPRRSRQSSKQCLSNHIMKPTYLAPSLSTRLSTVRIGQQRATWETHLTSAVTVIHALQQPATAVQVKQHPPTSCSHPL